MGRKIGTPKTPGTGKKKGSTVKQMTDEDYMGWVPVVVELLTVKKMAKWNIIKHLSAQGMSTFQATEAIKKAHRVIDKIYSDKAESSLEFALSQLNDMYEKADRDGDHRLALDIRKEINKLVGLHKERVEITGSLSIPTVIKIVSKEESNGDGDTSN